MQQTRLDQPRPDRVLDRFEGLARGRDDRADPSGRHHRAAHLGDQLSRPRNRNMLIHHQIRR